MQDFLSISEVTLSFLRETKNGNGQSLLKTGFLDHFLLKPRRDKEKENRFW